MRKFLVTLTIFLLAAGCHVQAYAQTKAPRVFVLDKNALTAIKSRILNKNAHIMPAYRQLLQEANKALKEGPYSVMEKNDVPPSGDKHDYMSLAPYFWPDSSKPNWLPYIRKDGQTNPEVKRYRDKEYMPKMISLVQTLSMAYYFSGNERYAQRAALLLKTWFLNPATKMNPNLNYAQAIKGVNEGRGAGIIDARHFIKVIDAIGLIRQSRYWSKEDQQGMKQWFGEFLHWMQTSKNGIDESDAPNNHGTWYDALRLSLALFTDDAHAAKEIVASAKQRLDQQMDDSGKFPKEMQRTIALHYTAFNLGAFFAIAAMAENVDINLWDYTSPAGKSLRKGFDAIKPYLANQKQWEGAQIKDFDFEEDAYPLLLMAASKLQCTDCRAAINKLPGKKSAQLRLELLNR